MTTDTLRDSAAVDMTEVIDALRNSPNYANLWSRTLADKLEVSIDADKARIAVLEGALKEIDRLYDDASVVGWDEAITYAAIARAALTTQASEVE